MELIERVTITGSKVRFRPARELRAFVPDDLWFSYDDDIDLAAMPAHIVALPFLWNVAPIVWAIDTEATVDVLDTRVAASFEAVRNELRAMYPLLPWTGRVRARETVTTARVSSPTHSRAALFTGGVDSTWTALCHAGPELLLVSIWGADIPLSDNRTWRGIEARNREFAQRHAGGLRAVRANLRAINYPRLSRLSPDIRKWLSHVQVSMAFTGITAPVLYQAGAETLHLASSVTPDSIDSVDYYASLPRLDDLISLGTAHVHHDGPLVSRQQKVNEIVEHVRKQDAQPPFLQVCIHHIPRGGGNCQHCEKCLRTMLSVVVAGDDPRRFGFPAYEPAVLESIRSNYDRRAIRFTQNECEFWRDLQEHVPRSDADESFQGDFWTWLRAFDFRRYEAEQAPGGRRGWARAGPLLARSPRVLSAARRARRGLRSLDPRN